MTRPTTVAGTLSQWMDDALMLGDKGLIEKAMKICPVPANVEEYVIFKLVRSGRVDDLSFVLNNFNVSLSSQSLRCLTIKDNDEERVVERRADVFPVLCESGLVATFNRMSKVDITVGKLFSHDPIVSKAEHLAFADDVFTVITPYKSLTLSCFLHLITLPTFQCLTQDESRLYSDFCMRWLPKLDLSETAEKAPETKLFAFVSTIATPEMLTFLERCKNSIDPAHFANEKVVTVTSLVSLSVIRQLAERYTHLRFNIESRVYCEVQNYFLSSDVDDLVWMFTMSKDTTVSKCASTTTIVSMAIAEQVDSDKYMAKLSEVLSRVMREKFDEIEQNKYILIMTNGAIRNRIALEGKVISDVMAKTLWLINDNAHTECDDLESVAGMMLLMHHQNDTDAHYRMMQGASKYHHRFIAKHEDLFNQFEGVSNPQLGDEIKAYSESWHTDVLARLYCHEKDMAKALQSVLRGNLSLENERIFHAIPITDVLAHLVKTSSSEQRSLVLKLKKWNGLDVLAIFKERDLKINNALKIDMMKNVGDSLS